MRVARDSHWYVSLGVDAHVRALALPVGSSYVYEYYMWGVKGTNDISGGLVMSLQATICEWQRSKHIIIMPSPFVIFWKYDNYVIY